MLLPDPIFPVITVKLPRLDVEVDALDAFLSVGKAMGQPAHTAGARAASLSNIGPRPRDASTLQRDPGSVQQCLEGSIDREGLHPLVGDPGPSMLGDDVTDEGHVVGQPRQVGEEHRQFARETSHRAGWLPAANKRTKATLTVDMLRLMPRRTSVRKVSASAARCRIRLRLAKRSRIGLLGPEELDRLHRAERLADESGHIVGGRPHRPTALADLRTDGLGQDPGEHQRYQQQAGEPQVDCPHHDHRTDSEGDQASHVDPVLEVLEEVFDVVAEGADCLARRQRHDP